MSNHFGFIDIILLAMFAGFIILRLRNILGRKTGHQGKSMGRYIPKGMEALKDMGYNLTNWKLATAAEEIIDDPDIEKLTEVTWRDWKDNYKGFMQYAIRDVEILMEIEKRLDVFNLYVTLQQLANLTSMNLVFFKSMIVDSYIL